MREQLHRLLTIQMDGLLEKITERDEELANQFSQTDMYSSNDATGSSAVKLGKGSRHARRYSRGTVGGGKSIILSPVKTGDISQKRVNPVYS